MAYQIRLKILHCSDWDKEPIDYIIEESMSQDAWVKGDRWCSPLTHEHKELIIDLPLEIVQKLFEGPRIVTAMRAEPV